MSMDVQQFIDILQNHYNDGLELTDYSRSSKNYSIVLNTPENDNVFNIHVKGVVGDTFRYISVLHNTAPFFYIEPKLNEFKHLCELDGLDCPTTYNIDPDDMPLHLIKNKSLEYVLARFEKKVVKLDNK